VDLLPWLRRILYEASTKAIFGDDFPQESCKDFFLFDDAFPKIVKGFPNFLWKDASQARERLHEYLGQHFKRKISEGLPADSPTFMHHRVDLWKTRGKDYTLRDIGMMELGFLWGSQANTVPSVFWMVANVISNTELQQEVLQSMSSSRKGKSSEPFALTEDFELASLLADPIMLSCTSEVLRMYADSLSIRHVEKDTVLQVDGQEFLAKKGTNVIVSGRAAVHMDEDIYNEPEKFKSKRFTNHNLEKTIIKLDNANEEVQKKTFSKNGVVVRHNLLPFGGGAALCPGRTFASNEILTFTATLLTYLDFKAPAQLPSIDITRAGFGVLPPSTSYMVEMSLKKEF